MKSSLFIASTGIAALAASYLGDVLALVAVPRALAGEETRVLRRVEEAADRVDASAEQDVHLHHSEWRRYLVLRHLAAAVAPHRRTKKRRHS